MEKVTFLVIGSEMTTEFETVPTVGSYSLEKGSKVSLHRMVYYDATCGLRMCLDESWYVVCDVFYIAKDDTICYHVCHEDDKESRAKFNV